MKDALQYYKRVTKAIRLYMPGAVTSPWGELDLSVAQVRTLFALGNRGPMVIGQIAQCLGIGVSTGGHLVEKLVQAGLVERAEDPEDRRRTVARLTARGEELHGRLFTGAENMIPPFVDDMSDEDLAAFCQGLKGLNEAIENRLPPKPSS
jgi:DNA-binding MarR family transcriptional regulator